MSEMWMRVFVVGIMTAYSLAQTTTTTTTESSQTFTGPDQASNTGFIGRDGKPIEPSAYWQDWRPDFRPVNNIQIGGGCCKAVPNNSVATDELLNMTRTILDLLQHQNQRVPSASNLGMDVRRRPRDCSEVQSRGGDVSGVYPIFPDGEGDPFFVYCDMDTDGGGWTVFQRREDGSVDFFLYWADYKYGFGSLSSEHWLGNDKIHRLTSQKTYQLRVDLEDFDDELRYAKYRNISVESEATNYTLTIGDYEGNAGDSMRTHSGHMFTTRDRDNDGSPPSWPNCANTYQGAWWYNACHKSNLNGRYLSGSTDQYATGVVWYDWLGHKYALKKTEMKIRPV